MRIPLPFPRRRHVCARSTTRLDLAREAVTLVLHAFGVSRLVRGCRDRCGDALRATGDYRPVSHNVGDAGIGPFVTSGCYLGFPVVLFNF